MERRIDEEANVNDNISENSIMNDVMVEDTGPEPAPVKLLSKSEPHGDASSVDGTQETDNNRISCKNHIEPYITSNTKFFLK